MDGFKNRLEKFIVDDIRMIRLSIGASHDSSGQPAGSDPICLCIPIPGENEKETALVLIFYLRFPKGVWLTTVKAEC